VCKTEEIGKFSSTLSFEIKLLCLRRDPKGRGLVDLELHCSTPLANELSLLVEFLEDDRVCGVVILSNVKIRESGSCAVSFPLLCAGRAQRLRISILSEDGSLLQTLEHSLREPTGR